eukprot:TRINITY_DN3187_c0_g1_i4.p1 TRINITY_DN3187_c0_g1~~TRINITY_DN3187_c0_g1_i4.p1  ORF type:complete len:303 (-),score=64.65 TRINITY_DN3187_c0_g1_i4:430-1338(-)
MLNQAMGFLLSPKVRASDDQEKKKGFLRAKGLNEDLIQLAIDRAAALVEAEKSAPTPAPAPAPQAATATPYSSKFLQVMQAVQRGEELPGVRTIDDKPRGNLFVPTASGAPPPLKPWQKNRTSATSKPYVAGLDGGNGLPYVKPKVDPRGPQEQSPSPPVGADDKLGALGDAAANATVARDHLQWAPIDSEAFSSTNLGDYCGADSSRPTLVSIDGIVFDVSSSESFKVGVGYNALAGRDASRSLAVMSLKPEELNSNLDGLDEEQMEVLKDWILYFKDKKKYPIVGRVPSVDRSISVEVDL